MKKMQDEIDSGQEKASQVDILKEQVAFLMQMQKSRENRVNIWHLRTCLFYFRWCVIREISLFRFSSLA
jgi:hypothetical protein